MVLLLRCTSATLCPWMLPQSLQQTFFITFMQYNGCRQGQKNLTLQSLSICFLCQELHENTFKSAKLTFHFLFFIGFWHQSYSITCACFQKRYCHWTKYSLSDDIHMLQGKLLASASFFFFGFLQWFKICMMTSVWGKNYATLLKI